MVNNCFLTHDCKKLRAYFNEAFDQVYELKEREMNVIRERIEKICYIDSELRTMFGQAVAYVPFDPQWHWQVIIRIIYRVGNSVRKKSVAVLTVRYYV